MKMIWGWIDALARFVIRLIGKISPKLGGLCEKLWNNTELVAYLFAGVATTVVNYVVYFIATRWFGLGVMPGTWAAWVLAVAFGYAVNKAFVFKTHCESMAALMKEAVSFFVAVEVLGLNDLVMKLLTNFIVIVLNYVFSKLFIFKKK